MNQSNKKNLEFIVNSGVNYFLQDSPRNWFENEKKSELSNTNINAGDKKNKIDEVIKDLKGHKSNLQKTAKNLVVYDGNLNAKVMLIGEAPGRDEDQQGVPFVGRAGQLLNKMLLAINLQREDVYITNVVNWRPADNRTPNDEEILEFLPFLQRQIDIVKPKFIFLLGGVAAKAILSTPLALGKLRGKWHEYKSLNLDGSIPTIASYHPAFLLRSPQYKKHSWEDLQMLQEKLKNVS
ncbi:uracil-DNA glycosylase [Pelagibacteraceae bacterium]|nr:uracil-DNA glycosylase [Pelagibacteraceae bacterium]